MNAKSHDTPEFHFPQSLNPGKRQRFRCGGSFGRLRRLFLGDVSRCLHADSNGHGGEVVHERKTICEISDKGKEYYKSEACVDDDE
jgi:hypothetical protein